MVAIDAGIVEAVFVVGTVKREGIGMYNCNEKLHYYFKWIQHSKTDILLFGADSVWLLDVRISNIAWKNQLRLIKNIKHFMCRCLNEMYHNTAYL